MMSLNNNKASLMFVAVTVMALCGKHAYADFFFGEPVNLGVAINVPDCCQGQPSI